MDFVVQMVSFLTRRQLEYILAEYRENIPTVFDEGLLKHDNV
jgi:hypothetical protein